MRKEGAFVVITIFLVFSSIPNETYLPASASCPQKPSLVYVLPFTFTQHSYFHATSYGTKQWQYAINAGLYGRQSALNRLYGPNLAAAMPSVSDNGLSWTVDMKTDLLFENGNPITTDDVVFTYHLLLSPAINKNSYSKLAAVFDNSSIKKIDDYTVRFDFKSSYAFGLTLLEEPIYDRTLYQLPYMRCLNNPDNCDFNSVEGAYTKGSAGPYKLLSITNDTIELVKNYNYLNEEYVWAENITLRYIETKEQAIEELTARYIDIIDYQYWPLPVDFTGLTGVEFASVSSPAHEEISINHLNPYFGTGDMAPNTGPMTEMDKNKQALLTRKAMSHLVNREFLVEGILDGLGQAAATTMPSASIGWDSSVLPDPYDIIEARNLMMEAGWDYGMLPGLNNEHEITDPDAVCGTIGDTDGCFFDVTILTSNFPPRYQWAALYANDLHKIGIGVKEVVAVDDATFRSRTVSYPHSTLVPGYEEGGYDIAFSGFSWGLDWDPTGKYTASGLCDSGDCSNFYNFINATIEAQIYDYLSEVNVTARNEKVADLQEMLAQTKPTIPLLYPQVTWAWAGDVLGLDLLLISGAVQEWGNVRTASWGCIPPDTPNTRQPDTTSSTEDSTSFSASGTAIAVLATVVVTSISRRKK